MLVLWVAKLICADPVGRAV